MKRCFILSIFAMCFAFFGCAKLDEARYQSYLTKKEPHIERYFASDIAQAKEALLGLLMIEKEYLEQCHDSHRSEAEWSRALSNVRLAMIAEKEGKNEEAQAYWADAIEAEGLSLVAAGKSRDQVDPPEKLRAFVLELEKNDPPKWRSANQRPDGTPAKSPPSNPGQVPGVPHP